ncbi:FAD-dependent monooxygenase [Mycobacterium sp. M1]|uniref:FAD-dependent monooxygenase n=1 Tax=Mycolicibacter acidiphilus TaxID=2835306 RepID=A0ABS5RGT4_9MYCO|nr:FAD-dependent monooxygenase [Mycolicibacter acidiphilus]
MVGAGISGLAAAVRLRQIGWTPVLVERAAGRRRGGYFVGVFGSGRQAATRLGIAEHLHDRRPTGAVYDYDRKGNRRVGLSFNDLPGEAWTALRGDVEAAAFAALPDDVEIRYATVPTEIVQRDDGVAVTLRGTADGKLVTEDFDLVVGADGVRSGVRSLVFGPAENYLRRLDHMIATFELPRGLSDLAADDGAFLVESGRSLVVYPFRDHPQTALLSYYTDDVDAEFSEPPIARLRKAFGPQPTGRLLGEVLDAFEVAGEFLFDSVEQVHMDSWRRGRVVLVGDAAWCETLYSGMGVSSSLAGPDLLGTMLARYGDDLDRALSEWERILRPYVTAYQGFVVRQRFFFVPDNRTELVFRGVMTRIRQLSWAQPLFTRIVAGSRSARLKDADITAAA